MEQLRLDMTLLFTRARRPGGSARRLSPRTGDSGEAIGLPFRGWTSRLPQLRSSSAQRADLTGGALEPRMDPARGAFCFREVEGGRVCSPAEIEERAEGEADGVSDGF
jgi:hypothetical protein